MAKLGREHLTLRPSGTTDWPPDRLLLKLSGGRVGIDATLVSPSLPHVDENGVYLFPQGTHIKGVKLVRFSPR